MSNPWDEFRARLAEHRDFESAVNKNVGTMARAITGRLRHAYESGAIYGHELRDLKRELDKFNARTGRWKG